MMLTDAGVIVALFDDDDPQHQSCVNAARKLRGDRIITVWPCLTEAMCLLGRNCGFAVQKVLWANVVAARIQMLDMTGEEIRRMGELMDTYSTVPMDLADASLMAAAEARGYKQVFTLDSDFRIYPLANGSVLEVVPQRSRKLPACRLIRAGHVEHDRPLNIQFLYFIPSKRGLEPTSWQLVATEHQT